MSDALAQHIERFVSIPKDDIANIATYFKKLHLKKKENLLAEGKVCNSNYFVENGLLRLFYVKDNGTEQTTHFAMENWWLTDYNSFAAQKPATFNIQAVEKSDVLALSYTAQEKLLREYPILERYFRLIHQRAHAASQFRIRWLYDLSKEQAYNDFCNAYPEFVQRIPQYLLASFLGFTPEYLSEIRAKRKS